MKIRLHPGDYVIWRGDDAESLSPDRLAQSFTFLELPARYHDIPFRPRAKFPFNPDQPLTV
ncbi:MAG: hypothetical protein HY053_09650 [Proteobacteria bacterium]|nr:hypothetical protein [Pseudomonadota bacterium]